jgi:hypothetical protein
VVRTKKVPKEVITWNDEVPQMAISTDGVDLVAYFPHGVKKAAHVHNVLLYLPHTLTPGLQDRILEDLYEFAEKVPSSMHKTCTSMGKPNVYKHGEGLVTGEHRVARSWLAIGQNVIFIYFLNCS